MRNSTKRRFEASEKLILGDYVYALRDPRNGEVFYVGQGKKIRLFDHFSEADKYLKKKNIIASPKVKRILEIWDSGIDVEWFILAHNLKETSNITDVVEAAAISFLEINNFGKNFHQNRGKHASLLNPQQLSDLSAPHVNPKNNYSLVFLFPIQTNLKKKIPVKEATECCWRIAKKYHKQEALAVGLSEYLSRGVFKLEQWLPHMNKYRFDGEELKKHELFNKKYDRIISHAKAHWLRGNYLIIQFDGQGRFKILKGMAGKPVWIAI